MYNKHLLPIKIVKNTPMQCFNNYFKMKRDNVLEKQQ